MTSSNVIENINRESANFKWEVDHVNRYESSKKIIKNVFYSKKFLINDSDRKMQWQLKLYHKKYIDTNKDQLIIYLWNKSQINVEATVKIYMLIDDVPEEDKCMHLTFEASTRWPLFDKFVDKNIINKLLECKLTILVEISLTEEVERKTPENLDRLSDFDDFEKLLSDEKFSDIKFKVDGKELRAHKNILAARSDVFRAMFEHNVKENNENEVDIVDIKYEVFKELLRYIYAGKVNDIKTIMDDLLVAAEKYSLDRLKAMCEKTIYKSLTAHNVIRYLSLANLHNATNLKSQAIEFIASNADDIIDKQEFELLGELAPNLMCTIVRTIVKKYKKSVSK